MGNQLAMAAVIGPIYMVIGLSILIYAKSWKALLEKWKEDHLDLFAISLIYLVLGMLIVRAHNVWAWNVWLLITLTGWGLLFKGVFFFLAPGSWIKKVLHLKANVTLLTVGGLVCAVIGAALGYYAYFA